jgi:hypothetical protein
LREVETPTFSDIQLTDGGKFVSPTRRPFLSSGRLPSVTVRLVGKAKPRGFSPQANYTDRPSDRRMSAKLVPTFAGRGCRVVSTTNPHGREVLDKLKKIIHLIRDSKLPSSL